MVLWMAAVFFSGVIVGGLALKFYTVRTVNAARVETAPKPDDFRRRYLDEMDRRLKLDEDQVRILNVILDETRERFNAMKERNRPEAELIKQEQRRKIREMLTSTQIGEFELLLKEKKERSKPNGAAAR
jgi:hypothetical protein